MAKFKVLALTRKILLGLVLLGLVGLSGKRLASALFLNLAYPEIAQLSRTTPDWFEGKCDSTSRPLSWLESATQQSTELDLNNSNSWLAYGRVQWLEGRCDEAISAWSHSLSLTAYQPVSTRFELGRVLNLKGRQSEAVQLFREINATSYFNTEAQQEKSSGNSKASIFFYNLSLKVSLLPETADALVLLYQEQNQPEKASQVWSQLVETTNQKQSIYWIAHAELDRISKDWLDARDAFETAMRLGPTNYDLYMRLSSVLSELKDWEELIEISKQAVQLQPRRSSVPYRNAAKAELGLGNYQKAINWYDQAVSAIPRGDAWPDIEAGQAAERYGYMAEAERRYRVSLERNPGYYWSNFYLGQLKYRQGDLKQGLAYMEKIAEPPTCGVLTNLIAWNTQLGNNDQAQKYKNEFDNLCR